MKKLITLFLLSTSFAFAQEVIDFNTPPNTTATYTTGTYYFDLTDVPADTIYNHFVNINSGDYNEDPSITNDANVLFDIGANSAINFGYWLWVQIRGSNVNYYADNEDFGGTILKFNVGADGSTGYISTNLSGGSQNSQIEGMKLFDFTDFDYTKNQKATVEIFKAGTWSNFNGNSEWVAFIDGEFVDLTYNGTTTYESINGIYLISLKEQSSLEENAKYENGRWVTYDLEFITSYVPEPSTWAAIFGVVTLAFVMYRRRK